ncbi:hypothetical protein BDN72DRAFT_902041 [Pluteus cervinus]|uniref:Uncharacterized protein n=1 Tax=Pluteus cervinus TaxID=181527 RepID=A0ACD3AEN1_9AGAR|nr:hypothetical protein BDN72DRAFT_902041 [Pluteus cervinus]
MERNNFVDFERDNPAGTRLNSSTMQDPTNSGQDGTSSVQATVTNPRNTNIVDDELDLPAVPPSSPNVSGFPMDRPVEEESISPAVPTRAPNTGGQEFPVHEYDSDVISASALAYSIPEDEDDPAYNSDDPDGLGEDDFWVREFRKLTPELQAQILTRGHPLFNPPPAFNPSVFDILGFMTEEKKELVAYYCGGRTRRNSV